MKKFKISICLSLVLCLCLFAGNTTFANEIPNNFKEQVSDKATLLEDFDTMTNDELNQYIDYMKYLSENNITLRSSAADPIEAAWLAGAQILENKGYPCAGKLMECSVWNDDYIEAAINANGLFSSKIVKTSAYKKYIAKIKAGGTQSGIEFTKSQNKDLFLALHNTDASTDFLYNVTITDTYDFKPTNYDDIFLDTINNWAWLSQQVGSLHHISVEITFMG